MTSLLPLDTSSTSVQGEDESQQQQQQEQCTTTIAAETPGNETQSNNISPTTTPFASLPAPTRIPHPNVPLRRSATMRLRSTKQQQQMQAELGSLPTGDFSTRAKLTPSSSPTPTPCPRKLTRNRTWCPLGHSAEQQQQQRKDTQQAQGDAARVQQQHQQHIREACSDIQFELHTSLDNMAASSAASKSSRNMSLKLNGSSSDPATNLTATATSTPKTPKTLSCSELSTPACAGSTASGHTCVRESHCARSTSKGSRKQEIISTKLSTVPEAKISPKTPPGTPDSPSTYLDDDLDSMYSFATTTSGRSTMSCEHPYVARNGTTFSGRKMKYVVHCSNYAGQVGDDYLTPTQRAQRQIRRLKELLSIARQDLETKDTEILRLTREVVELRLFKASLSSPEERSASSDAVTVREAELKTSQDVSPIVDMVDEAKCSPRHLARQQQQQQLQQQEQQQQQQHQQQHQQLQMSAEMQSSYADSGHFEDLTVSSVHSKDSQTQSDIPEVGASSSHLENYEMQRQELIRMYEQRIEELIRTQDGATSDMKRSHNDKVEALLQKLAECNTRYSDIVPDYEHAKQRIRELEKQLEDLQRKLVEHEEKQNRMYLHMYQQGQEAERLTRADQAMELAQRQPDSKVSINELLHQLQSTQDELENIRASECRMRECGSNHALLTAKEAISLWVLGARKTIYRRLLEAQKNRTRVDPEVTLQFLKSAIFYFLTDKENSQGHLQAIESILEFTDEERDKISHARLPNVAKFIVLCHVYLHEFFCNLILCLK